MKIGGKWDRPMNWIGGVWCYLLYKFQNTILDSMPIEHCRKAAESVPVRWAACYARAAATELPN